MRFGELSIDNFLTIRNVSVNLDNKGLVLVEGVNEEEGFDSNGAGKSTIYSEAIAWCLFGETIRGYTGDAVVNKFVKKNTRVRLAIYDGETKYEIIRHRKHSDFKNMVVLMRDGKAVTAKSDKDTTKTIEDILQMDFLSFTNSVLFGQGISKMFSSATDGDQKKILERMLRISIFRSMQDQAKLHSSEVSSVMAQLLVDRSALLGRKANSMKTLDDLQDKEANLHARVTARIEELNHKIHENVIESRKTQLLEATLMNDVNELKFLLPPLENDIRAFDIIQTRKNELDKKILEISLRLGDAENDLEYTTNRIKDIHSRKDVPAFCESCGQPLPKSDSHNIEGVLANLDFTKKAKKKLIKELQATSEEISTEWHNVIEQLEGKQELLETKQDLLDEIRNLEHDLKDARESTKRLSKELADIQKQIKEQEALLATTYTPLIESTIQDIKDIEAQLDDLVTQLKTLESKKEKYDFWVSACGNGGIKSVLLDSVTPFLNTRANYYLSKLAGTSMEVKFTTQTELKSGEKRDKFSVEVRNVHGGEDYKGNSGGEKRRIDIAVNMALQDLVNSRSNKRIDFLVYDEAYEGLDPIGCEAVIDLLREKSQEVGSIFVITHNPYFKELFEKSIRIVKSGGETRVYEE